MAQILNHTYEILEFVGKGGMSTVFKARHIRLDTIVAIKSVRKDQAIDLAAEVHILTKLNHPNLVRVFDIFEDERLMYIVMDYIEGEDLQHVIDREKVIPEEKVKEWFITLADLLRYLHSRKPPIIYRDMKPANVILQPDGTLKLIDFGIAREYKAAATGDTTYIGTNGFAAPEQFGKAQSDGRTDIYSLGMTMFYLATGKSPLQPPYGYTPARKLNPAVSPAMEAILEKCIKDNPEDRFQSADELLKALNDGMTYPLHPTNAFNTSGFIPGQNGGNGTGQGTVQTQPAAPSKKKFIPLVIRGILCVAAAVVAGIFFIMPKGSQAAAPVQEEEEEIIIDDTVTAEKGVLKVAVSGYDPPFSFEVNSSEVIGYDVLIAQKIADELGYELQIVARDDGNETAQLDTGAADLVIMQAPRGMHENETEESEPYFKHEIIIVFADQVKDDPEFDSTNLYAYTEGMNALVSGKRSYLTEFAGQMGMTAAGTVGASKGEITAAIESVNNGEYGCAVFSTEDMYNVYNNELKSYMVFINESTMDHYKIELSEESTAVNPDELVINAKKGNTQLVHVVNKVLSGITPAERSDLIVDALKAIVIRDTGN